MRYTLCAICLLVNCFPAIGQLNKGINYAIESNIIWSNGDNYAPFWLTSNRYGLSSVDTNNGYLRAGLFRSTEQDSIRKWRQGYGLDVVAAYNHTSSFIIQQAYYDVAYKWLQLTIGSKERPSALKNPLLSSGGMTFGTNGRPIPTVRVEIPQYVTIPGTKGWLHFKGYLGYGLYTDNQWQKDFVAPNTRYTQNALHHEKAGFIKIGNEQKFPFYFEGGLEMAAQFGGTAYNVSHGRGEVITETIHMGSGIKDFFKALIPFGGGGDPTDGAGYENVSGNHLGSWHASFTYQAPTWKIRGYYEHFFEDHSMIIDEFAWKEYVDGWGHGDFWSYIPPIIPTSYYWRDGLYGLEITFPKNRIVKQFVYEYMATKEQSGPIYHDHTPEISDQISGIDNYYNHTIYTGWQHWGMSMGNPFVLSPIYNTDRTISFQNNRVIAHHVGMYGEPLPELNYRILVSHTKYWGTYTTPLLDTKEQTSTLLEITYSPFKWKGWTLKGAFAYDHGKALGNNCGGMITIRKTGTLTR